MLTDVKLSEIVELFDRMTHEELIAVFLDRNVDAIKPSEAVYCHFCCNFCYDCHI